jgi:Caspase domain
MMRSIIRILTVALAFLGSTASWSAAVDRRVALVIGNATYKSASKLGNPLNDADDVSKALKRIGLAVIDGRDLDRQGMRGALIAFARLLQQADAGLFYYAGHGLQVNGKNYLVPIDAEVEDESAVTLELIKLDDVIDALGNTSGVRLLVLDACRQNPFTERLIRATGLRAVGVERGLARMECSRGMLIVYSTQPNAVADDGEGRNSVFTAALVHERPGLEIATLFRLERIMAERLARMQTGGDEPGNHGGEKDRGFPPPRARPAAEDGACAGAAVDLAALVQGAYHPCPNRRVLGKGSRRSAALSLTETLHVLAET